MVHKLSTSINYPPEQSWKTPEDCEAHISMILKHIGDNSLSTNRANFIKNTAKNCSIDYKKPLITLMSNVQNKDLSKQKRTNSVHIMLLILMAAGDRCNTKIREKIIQDIKAGMKEIQSKTADPLWREMSHLLGQINFLNATKPSRVAYNL